MDNNLCKYTIKPKKKTFLYIILMLVIFVAAIYHRFSRAENTLFIWILELIVLSIIPIRMIFVYMNYRVSVENEHLVFTDSVGKSMEFNFSEIKSFEQKKGKIQIKVRDYTISFYKSDWTNIENLINDLKKYNVQEAISAASNTTA
jgi:hypothetical protein